MALGAFLRMGELNRILWRAGISCWALLVFAVPGQAASASEEQAVSPANKTISSDPVKDYEKAEKLNASGISNGDMGAMIDATELFRRAADAGHAKAQARYALNLERGSSVEEAMKYYRMSADQNDMDGQFGLGKIYRLGEGVPQNFEEARKWLTLAAEQGHKSAIDIIAAAYLRNKISDEEAAAQRPREASAYITVGMGLDEEARQGSDALMWIKRAAEIDSLLALDALAVAYRSGAYGLAVDVQQSDAIVAKANKLRGTKPKVERKKSRLYRLLRGDDKDNGSVE